MDEYTDYLLSGPPFELEFSPVDQVTPPVYSRRILIFSRHPEQDDAATVRALQDGLQTTTNEIPILAGQMGYNPQLGWTIKPGVARLRIKSLHKNTLTFSELELSDFDEAKLPADLVSSVPTLADPQEEWHACRIQANFIQGGLLLVVSINHTTMDGYGITKVIEALARNCRAAEHSPAPPTRISCLDRSRLSAIKLDNEGDINKLPAYSIVPASTQIPPPPPKIITKTFRHSIEELQFLKKNASPSSPEQGVESWITTHDAVNAYWWTRHAQSRYNASLINDNDTARFAFPVNFRQILTNLPQQYIGNAVLMTKVELPVRVLLSSQDGLRAAAAAIRAGVNAVDAAYVENFIAVAKSITDYPDRGRLRINMRLEKPETAFGSTSYKSFDHSGLGWDQTAIGKFERMRLAFGVTGEGMTIVLPVLKDGSWEVTVTAEEELMGEMDGDRIS
ncbi:transferase [Apodospora peruviana]|uniref:Transferase n=1 Tax=Apodospora peruviana TaxID=516989 RepID=A0AAE0HZU5_9PEZI|nr:transferase [Apodospora peruviana]